MRRRVSLAREAVMTTPYPGDGVGNYTIGYQEAWTVMSARVHELSKLHRRVTFWMYASGLLTGLWAGLVSSIDSTAATWTVGVLALLALWRALR